MRRQVGPFGVLVNNASLFEEDSLEESTVPGIGILRFMLRPLPLASAFAAQQPTMD